MKEKLHDISCAILAGGKSKRLDGENKALIKIGEKSNLDKILSFSGKYFREVMIIANDRKKFESYSEVQVFPDEIEGVGPLGGIHSALKNSRFANVFFLSCDMPFLSEEIISNEIEAYFDKKCDMIIPRTGEFIEPLHSIFSIRLLSKLEDHLKVTNNYAIRKFFDKVEVYYWDIADSDENRKAFFNINTHSDLQDAHKRSKITN